MRKHESLFLAFWVVRIREFRIKMELTQEKLAEKLCLSTRNYQKLERGCPQAVRHNDHPVPIPALRPRNHLFHPLLWLDGRKNPFPGGCLTMQTKTPYIPTREQKSAVPLENFDIHEDENILVNRLYYAVPRFENGRFQCSVFYEENTFCKDADGDLILVHSEYGIDDPLESE